MTKVKSTKKVKSAYSVVLTINREIKKVHKSLGGARALLLTMVAMKLFNVPSNWVAILQASKDSKGYKALLSKVRPNRSPKTKEITSYGVFGILQSLYRDEAYLIKRMGLALEPHTADYLKQFAVTKKVATKKAKTVKKVA